MSALTTLAELIESEASTRGTYTSAEVAEAILKGNPQLVREWLDESTATLLTKFVTDHLRHTRHHLQRRKKAEEEGWASVFDQSFVVNDEHVRMRLGDMRAADHLYVASQYEREANTARQKEHLHRLIAKKVGKKRTEEVFNEEQLISLFGSYGSDPTQEKAA